VELDRLVEDAARQGAVLGRARAVHVGIRSLEPLIVEGDEQRLRQLLLNLVDNAVKYTPSGGRVDLDLRAAKPDEDGAVAAGVSRGECAEIAVRDSGVGIPPEALPRIFDRFYRVDGARSREAGGTGLGLCIAKTIAEAHQGTIQVQSTPGIGTTFTVRLPLPA
jgi:signal transduction histidine kinase